MGAVGLPVACGNVVPLRAFRGQGGSGPLAISLGANLALVFTQILTGGTARSVYGLLHLGGGVLPGDLMRLDYCGALGTIYL